MPSLKNLASSVNNKPSLGLDKFVAWSLALAIVLFSVIHFSDSWTYLNAVQKVGNSLDDARLTNAVVSSSEFSEVKEHINFGNGLTGPAYVLNKFLGVESRGRRILSFLVVLSSFVYLLVVLARYRLLSSAGLLVFARRAGVIGGCHIA